MISIIERLSELGSVAAWFYRGFGLLISSDYRQEVRFEYSKMSGFSKTMDIILSISFFIAELFLIGYLIIRWVT